MINKKHIELGNLTKFLISNGCYLEIKPEGYRDMVARVYDNEEGITLDYPRWTVVSRTGYSDLIVYGDITEDGYPIVDITPMEIVSLYKKWVEEGKPSKEYTKKIKGVAEPDDEETVGFDDYDEEVVPEAAPLEKEA